MREIRKLSKDHHQTSIITTNRKLSIEKVAKNMFLRWTQENYFKYMRKDYDFDRVMQYVVEQIDNDIMVSNPIYNNLCYLLKKLREKIGRKQAKLFKLMEENVKDTMENTSKQLKRQAKEKEELVELLNQEDDLINQRKCHRTKIKNSDLPVESKYNRLHIESKHFQNIIKMICYRAESSCANVLGEYYRNHKKDKRELVKSLICNRGDIICDDKNETLNVFLYSQSSPRLNYAQSKLCELLNDAEQYYPGTNLRLFYNIAK